MKTLRAWWHRWFLEERPSLELGAFRIAVALTVGCHMIPSFLRLADNYLATAFREYNASFFPIWTLQWVNRSPDWVVLAFVAVFFVSWLCFLIGLRSQTSCLIMTLSCYYFYARNSLHIGTLSFDILLVTLALMCATNYHGDWLSMDSVLRGDPRAYTRRRPFFIQRLLQLQIVTTFWHTALGKFTAGGNWLTDHPYSYLMHYPPEGVVRQFPFRDVLAQHPVWCDRIQVAVIAFELSLPILLLIGRTRLVGLILGFGFHVMLLVTLHVPTIFFFLFPPQLLLFVNPERPVRWIEAARAARAAKGRGTLFYDGQCGFCRKSVAQWSVLDVFGWIEPVDFHTAGDLTTWHPALTVERCQRRMQLVEPGGTLSEGYFAFRRISLHAPMLWPIVPLLYVPGAGWIGQRVYDGVAKRRFWFHSPRACGTNQCGAAASTDEGTRPSSNA